MLGGASGAVAGLVAITPACGYVGPMGGLVIGLLAGIVCLWGVNGLKRLLGADDALDVFGVHGIGGLMGCLLTGIFATNQINNAQKLPNGSPAPLGWVDGNAAQLMNQGIGAVIGIAFGVIGTIIALKVTGLITPLRLQNGEETAGMDITLHGEEGYLFED